ncbi:hypothetical protein SOHN41_00710 [Shewanella sp. HN-41]|nr:hypothetical protein SOHN41_00710 [Shewanella sp. HN-41]
MLAIAQNVPSFLSLKTKEYFYFVFVFIVFLILFIFVKMTLIVFMTMNNKQMSIKQLSRSVYLGSVGV